MRFKKTLFSEKFNIKFLKRTYKKIKFFEILLDY